MYKKRDFSCKKQETPGNLYKELAGRAGALAENVKNPPHDFLKFPYQMNRLGKEIINWKKQWKENRKLWRICWQKK